MEWTEFDANNRATIMLSRITSLARNTTVWLSVDGIPKNNRNRYEYQVLIWAAAADIKVLIMTDRGLAITSSTGRGQRAKVRMFPREYQGHRREWRDPDGDRGDSPRWTNAHFMRRLGAEGHLVGAGVCVQTKDLE
jgi:hypothetical protein